MSWPGYQRRRAPWGGGEDEFRALVERHGCEGALIMCYQMESEHDCYRVIEEECTRINGSSDGSSGKDARDDESSTTDCEPGPSMY